MSSIDIKGHVAPGFEPAAEAFAKNFEDGLEAGASFAAQAGGETVIDIWAGTAVTKVDKPWSENTLAPVFSTGKAVTALVIASLAERGLIDYDAPLADLWPDFAQHGKGEITIAQALSHQAGVPGFREEMDPADWFDMDGIAAKLAAEQPFWEPGTQSGYHAITFGIIAQEIARRSDGRTIGTILREDFAEPNGLDLIIGTPEAEHERVAAMEKPKGYPDFGKVGPETRAAFLQPWSSPGRRGSAAWRESEFPAANCHATARSLAEFMNLIARRGRLGGTGVLSDETFAAMTKERIHGPDRVLPFDIAWAAGLTLNRPDEADWFGPGEQAAGHYGFGGSCAFGDPEREIAAAYVMNQQGRVLVGDERPRRIIRALYGAL
ncbi:MAG: beta-lactamase family protein [Euryhalocaulis sp.]|uniref:serine hydrolase domain-containing protein n=1 Tax=Euryhalocaulis sp. TaxID=2744307 RepID=UPI00185113F5|nr:serine hydrolase domain-containing protein [Euryhalocaulis sp.]MBA4800563.1 beta-lactamase family protein [Euryhalocaulis sp.]